MDSFDCFFSNYSSISTDKTTQVARKKNGLNVILYLVYLVILLEISLQIFYFVTVGQWLCNRTSLPIFVPNKYSIFWNKPNLHVPFVTSEFKMGIFTNNQGLRVPEGHGDYPLGKQAGIKRIIVMGPSFAFGWGVNYNKTYEAQLEKILRQYYRNNKSKIEVINAGVPALGPIQNLGWYNQFGKQLAPDIVIQLIYGSMSIPPRNAWNDFRVTPKGYLIERTVSTLDQLMGYAKNSAIIFYGWFTLTKLKPMFSTSIESNHISGAGRALELHGVFNPNNSDVTSSLMYYQNLRSTVEQSGAKLLVLYLPLSYCVHPEDTIRWSHLGVKNIEQQIQYDAAFCKFLTSEGFDCLNITNDFRKMAEQGKRLYYYLDIHWTPEGNELAARLTAKHLR